MPQNVSKHIDYLVFILFLLSVFGLQIWMVIPVSLGQPTTPFSIVFRGICFSLTILLIIVGVLRKDNLNVGNFFIVGLFVFWIIYGIRIIYDIEVMRYDELGRGIKGTQIYLFSFCLSFAPLIAIGLNIRKNSFSGLQSWVTNIALIQAIFTLVALLMIFGLNPEVFISRYTFMSLMSEELGGMPINPIVASRVGAMLIVLCLTELLFFDVTVARKRLMIASMLLGLIMVAVGNSRGPLAALVLTTIFLFARYFKLKHSVKVYLAYGSVIILITFLFIWLFTNYTVELDLINRVFETFSNEARGGKPETRVLQWQSAYNQFLRSPIWGDKMFEEYQWIYPHNVILEVLMATGIIGALFFFPAFIYCIVKFFFALNNRSKNLPFFVVLIVWIIFNMFSNGLYNSPEFWTVFTVCCILNHKS